MIQDILTVIAVGGASGYTIYSFIKTLINAKQKKTSCSGCVSCTPKQNTLKIAKKYY